MRVSLQVYSRSHHHPDAHKNCQEGILLKMRLGISNKNRKETRTYKT